MTRLPIFIIIVLLAPVLATFIGLGALLSTLNHAIGYLMGECK